MFIAVCSRDSSPPVNVFNFIRRAVDHAGVNMKLMISHASFSVSTARNNAVDDFLASGEEHLFFVDDDVLLPQNAISDLVKLNAPVATGCVPVMKSTGLILPISTVEDWHLDLKETEPGVYTAIARRRTWWWKGWFKGIKDIRICGAGCLMIKRQVFETLDWPWFKWPEEHIDAIHHRLGEDADFCDRVRARGHQILAHGDVRCGHMKKIDLGTIMPAVEDSDADQEYNPEDVYVALGEGCPSNQWLKLPAKSLLSEQGAAEPSSSPPCSLSAV